MLKVFSHDVVVQRSFELQQLQGCAGDKNIGRLEKAKQVWCLCK